MQWRQAVIYGIVRHLDDTGGDVFTRQELLRQQLPTILRLTGTQGTTPEQMASRVLLELRDEGAIQFQGNGKYQTSPEGLQAHLNLEHPFNNLDIGESYTRASIQPLAMQYGYGRLTAGITPKGSFPMTESVVVFADVGGGRYGNFWDDETGDLWYVGEDDSRTFGKDAKGRDQNHAKGKNRVLSHQQEYGYPIYLFTRSEGQDAFRFHGISHVVSFDYFRENDRRVVRYRLRPVGVSSAVLDFQLQAQAESSLVSALQKPPVLEEPEAMVETRTLRRYRSQMFSRNIKLNYENRCAVCTEERYDYKERPEVEAAHIYPVANRGSNDVRNGLALCRFHHWAFDGHLYYVDTKLRVKPTLCGQEINGVREFADAALAVSPTDERAKPHRRFLEARESLVPAFLLQPG